MLCISCLFSALGTLPALSKQLFPTTQNSWIPCQGKGERGRWLLNYLINEFNTAHAWNLYTNIHISEGSEYLQYSLCDPQNWLNNLIHCQKALGEVIRRVALVFYRYTGQVYSFNFAKKISYSLAPRKIRHREDLENAEIWFCFGQCSSILTPVGVAKEKASPLKAVASLHSLSLISLKQLWELCCPVLSTSLSDAAKLNSNCWLEEMKSDLKPGPRLSQIFEYSASEQTGKSSLS